MKGLAVAPDFDRQVEMMRRTLLSVPNLEELIRMTDLDHTVHSDIERVKLIENLSNGIRNQDRGSKAFSRSAMRTRTRVLTQRVVDSILQIFVEQNLGHSQQDVEEARDFIDKTNRRLRGKASAGGDRGCEIPNGACRRAWRCGSQSAGARAA